MKGSLASSTLFATLSRHDRDILDRLLVTQSYPPGHIFIEEGKRAKGSMFLLISGEVEVVCRAPAGGFGVRRTMGPGEVFGIVAFLDDAPRSATVRARDKVTAAHLSRQVFDELYRHNAGVYSRFQLAIARQLATDVRRLDAAFDGAVGNLEGGAAAGALGASLDSSAT